jgi:hypothetical protein
MKFANFDDSKSKVQWKSWTIDRYECTLILEWCFDVHNSRNGWRGICEN